MIVTEHEAKAVEAVAKTTGVTLETAQKVGKFLGRVFGTLPEDVVGVLVGDWLHHVRMRRCARLAARTEQLLSERNLLECTQPVSPSLALPLLQAAQDEDRDELSEMWANLVANAMDPNKSKFVERWIIETLKSLEPIDVAVLNEVSKYGRASVDNKSIPSEYFLNLFSAKYKFDHLELSIDRLTSQFNILTHVSSIKNTERGNAQFSFRHGLSEPKNISYQFLWSPKGRQFIRAVLANDI